MHVIQQHNYDEAESLQKIQVEKEEEEEKNQRSPVSVLAPPFQDDDEQHRGDEEDSEFDTERSYASVQSMSSNFEFFHSISSSCSQILCYSVFTDISFCRMQSSRPK